MCRDMVAESALVQSIERAPRVRLDAAVDRSNRMCFVRSVWTLRTKHMELVGASGDAPF